MENSSDTIGNPARGLPACSACRGKDLNEIALLKWDVEVCKDTN